MASHGRDHPFSDDGASGPLRPKRALPPTGFRKPAEPDLVSGKLTTLTHELANLVDGSMRQLGLALRQISDPTSTRDADEDLANRITIVLAALEKMAEALRLATGGPPGFWLQDRFNAKLSDAVRYGVGILEAAATERNIKLETSIDPKASDLLAGHIYTVVVNAVRNAIESIVAANVVAGLVRIELEVIQRGGVPWVHIEIADNGAGPPVLPPGRDSIVFDPSFSTKPGGLGVGLALCRQIVESLHGTIELNKRPVAGAKLVMNFPASSLSSSAHSHRVVG
jgi:signal transduction histidine kinase